MAKTYVWNDNTGRIDVAGGTVSDPITFKNIVDYFEANPLPLNYNLPRLYSGTVVITGDTTTYSPTAGDKIAVTINGVLYDNIDISGCSSIATVVTAINSATTAYYNVSGYVVASSYGGNLRLTVRCEDESGDVTIADGSGTSSSCIAKLFNTATRTASTTSSPYELTEGNASNWFGLGGFGTPADDTSAGDFCRGTGSVTAQVSSVPTGITITRVDSTGSYVIVYMADTSSFSLYDEVEITGTTNFPGVRFRITYISTNVYVRGVVPRYCPLANETSLSGATLIKRLTLAWNNTYAVAHTTPPFTGISLCDKFKMSAKSDGAGSPKIVGIIVRNYYGSGSPDNFFYGAYINVDWDLTSSFQDFEFDLRDMANWQWIANTSSRGYWSSFSKLYIVFDGLAQNENVWIDGVRFTNSDRNPKRISEQNYVFTTGLRIPAGCYFKDYGFNVRLDLLESLTITNSYSYGVLDFAATNVGELQLGDYSGVEKEGGVFIFNHFCQEDTGSLTFVKVQCQGITFMGHKDSFGGFNFYGNSYNNYRDCSWINMINFFTSESGSTFEDCVSMGWRYLFAFPQAGININGFTAYGGNNLLYIRSADTIPTVRGLKFIDATASRVVINSDTYGTGTLRQGVRVINLDLSQCGTSSKVNIQNYSTHAVTKSPIHYVAFSLNLTVTDESGNAISGATVVLKDKDNNQLFSTTTSASGVITEQIVDILKAQYDTIPPSGTSSKAFYFDTPTVDWTYYYPFTLTVSKSGYETYTDTLLKDGYSRTNEICKNGANLTIALKRSQIQTDQEMAIRI